MQSPYAARENGQRISAKYLAQRLRALAADRSSTTTAPGSVIGLQGTELLEFADLLEPNFTNDIERIYAPYGSDVSRYPAEDPTAAPLKIAVLLRGVVEVQAPFHGTPNPGDAENLYPVTILRAPALIWVFEAIPETKMQHHHVRILSGVQSFTVLLSLSQLQPWKQIFKRSSTNIPYRELKTSAGSREPKHTNLFKWSRRWQRAPTFTWIAGPSNEWSTELAFLDVGPIFTKSYNELSDTERHLRDVLYRNTISRFGANLRRHVPGYRPGSPKEGDAAADGIHEVATFIREVHIGQQPHHTCCFNFEEVCNLFPAKTLTWNIYDFMRLAVGRNVVLTKFISSKRSTGDQLDQETMVRFFDNFLYRFIYVPSFSVSSDVCLYSPILWAHDDMNTVLRNFDPRNAEELQKVFAGVHNASTHDFHIKTSPMFFRSSEFGGGVPKSISEIIMDGGIFFRKKPEEAQPTSR